MLPLAMALPAPGSQKIPLCYIAAQVLGRYGD